MEDAIVTNRRAVLRWAGSGMVVAFAGCSSNSGGGNRHTATGGKEIPRMADNKPSVKKQNGIEIIVSKFETVKKTIPPDDVVRGKLKNTSNKHITTLEVEALFRNRKERVIDTSGASVEGLEPGGVWEPYLQPFETSERVATGELAIKKVVTGSPPEKPDAAEIIEDSLRPAHEFKTPTAAGEIENTGEEIIDRLEADAAFYAKNDSLLDTGSVDIVSLHPDETREFEIEFSGYEELAAPPHLLVRCFARKITDRTRVRVP